jgi:hypothetical protein
MPVAKHGDRLARALYLAGPLLLTIIMTAGSVAYSPWRHRSTWAASAILIGGLVVVLWHVALIASKNRKPWLLGYAVVNVGLYAYLGFFCLMIVTGEAI